MKVCVLIPAYNEAPFLGAVVEGARRHVTSVVVIDDGSDDETETIARASGATCLRTIKNSGKGSALLLGFAYACANNFTHVITLDGDGQHLPEDIPAILQVAQDSGADMVIGARPFDRALMPPARYYSNTIGSRLASKLVGCEIQDSQSGFRLLSLEKLRQIKLRSRRYEIEMEVLIKMARSGCSIAHSPIHLVYQDGIARSKMNPIQDTARNCLWSFAFRFLGA